MFSKIKNILIFIVIGAIVIAAYYYFFAGNADEPSLVATTDPLTGAPVSTDSSGDGAKLGQDFLVLLLNVRNIKLDDSIFASPAFATLRDSTIVLVQDMPEGRPNPFAPIGSENSASPAPATPPPATPIP